MGRGGGGGGGVGVAEKPRLKSNTFTRALHKWVHFKVKNSCSKAGFAR